MQKTFFTFVLVFYTFLVFAQEPKIVIDEIVSEVEWDIVTESRKDAEERAYNLAIDELLNKVAPTNIAIRKDLNVKNVTSGNKTKSEVSMDVSSESIVRGEIIDILRKEFEDVTRKEKKADIKNKVKVTYILCNLKAKIRIIDEPLIKIKAYASTSAQTIVATNDFKIGDYFYLYFESPVSGYLNIYVQTPDVVARIFPYSSMSAKYENGVAVEADTRYVLFSKKHPNFNEPAYVVDELKFLESGLAVEKNTIFIVFTKNPLNKPSLRKDKGKITEKDIKKGFKLPPSLSKNEFKAWRLRNLTMRSDMQIRRIPITITK